MKIAFIGFPLALGADRKGVELAPDYDTSGASTAVATKVIRELLMII